MQPVYTVEKSGFIFLVSKLNPRYSLQSRKYFTEVEIPKLYVEVRDTVVKPKLAEMEFFAATSDLWTSRAKHPYCCFQLLGEDLYQLFWTQSGSGHKQST